MCEESTGSRKKVCEVDREGGLASLESHQPRPQLTEPIKKSKGLDSQLSIDGTSFQRSSGKRHGEYHGAQPELRGLVSTVFQRATGLPCKAWGLQNTTRLELKAEHQRT